MNSSLIPPLCVVSVGIFLEFICVEIKSVRYKKLVLLFGLVVVIVFWIIVWLFINFPPANKIGLIV